MTRTAVINAGNLPSVPSRFKAGILEISRIAILYSGHSQLENELLQVALGRLLRHDVAHLLAHRSDLRRLRVARLLDLVVLLLGEADARLMNNDIQRNAILVSLFNLGID